ncbi:hypothetical protein SAMN02949497_4649 [Methylomagnum ishizawai]|uniref:Uncharacterized protein n=1 Tax=Methylomagnum ishizawai TaxID=1760988 RepID=A0A1Y6D2Q5_9GAMM|nr:hypothetical protein [Methylomagnum ishizawai]SMF97229.1 hypothetical protein SAMN02949497_4649 [Methylomagnum ishizawai]
MSKKVLYKLPDGTLINAAKAEKCWITKEGKIALSGENGEHIHSFEEKDPELRKAKHEEIVNFLINLPQE